MEKINLIAHKREVFGKKLRTVRTAGDVPAIVYGQEKEPEPVTVNGHEFTKIYARAGHNTIIDLKIDQDASDNVLIQAIANDPVNGDITHADFYRVNMSQAIRTSVPIHFVGESPAVYQDEGTLLSNLEEVEVETLPAKLPSNIEVDISILDDFEKTIHVSDLKVPEGVTILADAEELVCKVDPPRSEEEMEALNDEIVEEIPAEEGAEGTDTEAATEGEEGKPADKPAE